MAEVRDQGSPQSGSVEEQQQLRDEVQRLRDEQQRLRDEQERVRQQSEKAPSNGSAKSAEQSSPEAGAQGGEQKPKEDEKEKKPAGEQRAKGFFRSHPILIIGGLVALMVLIFAGVVLWKYLQSYESTDDAEIGGHIDSISSRIDGTVVGVYFEENQFVKKGQTLVKLDPRDYQVTLNQAAANLQQSQAQVAAEDPNVSITSTNSETTISTTEADVITAQAGVVSAQSDYEAGLAEVAQAEANSARDQADLVRYRLLVQKDEVSEQQYDAKVAAAKASAAGVASAQASAAAAAKVIDQRKAQLAQARTRLAEANRNAPRQLAIQKANVDARRAGALALKAALDRAKLNVDYTRNFAPIDGVIGKKSVEVGQHVQPGQELLAIVPLSDIWVTANFKETQIRRMRAGQSVTIHVDAFGSNFNGYIESLPAASGALYSLLPPENATGNYVKVVQRLPVRIRFKPNQDPDHRLRPGMSVEPKVWVN